MNAARKFAENLSSKIPKGASKATHSCSPCLPMRRRGVLDLRLRCEGVLRLRTLAMGMMLKVRPEEVQVAEVAEASVLRLL